MLGAIFDGNGSLGMWCLATLSLVFFYFLAWRQYRTHRVRPPYDRVRAQQRRAYWGWE